MVADGWGAFSSDIIAAKNQGFLMVQIVSPACPATIAARTVQVGGTIQHTHNRSWSSLIAANNLAD